MSAFDIDKAKAGHQVVTRDGRTIRIICFDRIAVDCVVGLTPFELPDGSIEEYFITVDKNGKFLSGCEHDNDFLIK